MKTAEDRLADLLNERDADIDTLKSRISQLEQQLQSAASGWREPRSLAEDMSLPIPRLELQYTPDPELGWSRYTVVYMLVRKHLLGHLSGIPLGSTKIESNNSAPPADDHLPFRDAAHAAHDSAHLGLPAYRVVDGVAKKLHFTDWPNQVSLGMRHRRKHARPEPGDPVLTASGHRLDVLGERAEVFRRPDESDAEYRARVVAEIRARQRGGTRTSE